MTVRKRLRATDPAQRTGARRFADRRQRFGRLARPTSMSRSRRALLLLALGTASIAAAGIATVAGQRPAWADCAAAAPTRSPHWFTGVVVQTTNVDRTAFVHTDDGRDVIVLGSYVDGANAHTTVDRTYQVGVRYEFDPANGSSPYQDNRCTATHPLDAAATDAARRPDGDGGRAVFWAIGGLVVVAVVGGVAISRVRGRGGSTR
jgi:hypothetical protein